MASTNKRRSALAAGAIALTGMVVLAACQPATFDAKARTRSVVNQNRWITVDMETEPICDGSIPPITLAPETTTTLAPETTTTLAPETTLAPTVNQITASSDDDDDDCDADLVTKVEGSFTDAGTNAAWPSGVKMSFEGTLGPIKHGVALGIGAPAEACNVGITPTGGSKVAEPKCFAGLVTYRSTNKRYPNNTSIDACLAGLGEELTLPTSLSGRSGSSKRNELSGVALVVFYDADVKARSNNGDAFFLASLCGPYSNIEAKTGVLDGATPYSYATCPVITGTAGGVLPGGLTDIVTPTEEMPFENCLRLITSGDIDIDLVPTTTLPPETTTTLPPETTTTPAPETTTTTAAPLLP